MRINTETGKAFVFSSGKDMGVFKGVGFPEDVADFFCFRRLPRIPLVMPQQIPNKHSWLVGRSTPIQHTGLDS